MVRSPVPWRSKSRVFGPVRSSVLLLYRTTCRWKRNRSFVTHKGRASTPVLLPLPDGLNSAGHLALRPGFRRSPWVCSIHIKEQLSIHYRTNDQKNKKPDGRKEECEHQIAG